VHPLKSVKKELWTRALARRDFETFVRYLLPGYQLTEFHKAYISVVAKFAQGEIKNLIVSVPPQHGKTEISTRALPPFILGQDPNKKIAIASYSSTQATKFHRAIQRNMDSQPYRNVFPGTRIPAHGAKDGVRNTEETEILGHDGSIRAVGRGGALTGNTLDVGIIDDLYKDAMEAHSPVIREATIEWYDTVMDTRFHNASQRLTVFTRWHELDLVGHIEKTQKVHRIKSLDDVAKIPKGEGVWAKINFPAIQDSAPTPLDPRKKGTPLWPDRHSLEKLETYRAKNPAAFGSLYQGDPKPAEGLLYKEFGTYKDLDPHIKGHMTVVDTAGTGTDFTCAITFKISTKRYLYITDVYYSNDDPEVAETEVARQVMINQPQNLIVERNNGGEGFLRSVKRILKGAGYAMDKTFMEDEFQGANKEARILSNSTFVNNRVLFPDGWKEMWPKFTNDLTSFRKQFKANLHDDGPDTLTMAVEKAGIIEDNEGAFISINVF
jgi:predicted phage terminase large subunit-like protein